MHLCSPPLRTQKSVLLSILMHRYKTIDWLNRVLFRRMLDSCRSSLSICPVRQWVSLPVRKEAENSFLMIPLPHGLPFADPIVPVCFLLQYNGSAPKRLTESSNPLSSKQRLHV